MELKVVDINSLKSGHYIVKFLEFEPEIVYINIEQGKLFKIGHPVDYYIKQIDPRYVISPRLEDTWDILLGKH